MKRVSIFQTWERENRQKKKIDEILLQQNSLKYSSIKYYLVRVFRLLI